MRRKPATSPIITQVGNLPLTIASRAIQVHWLCHILTSASPTFLCLQMAYPMLQDLTWSKHLSRGIRWFFILFYYYFLTWSKHLSRGIRWSLNYVISLFPTKTKKFLSSSLRTVFFFFFSLTKKGSWDYLFWPERDVKAESLMQFTNCRISSTASRSFYPFFL